MKLNRYFRLSALPLTFVLACFFCAAPCLGEENGGETPGKKTYPAVWFEHAPVIDGVLDEMVWKNISYIDDTAPEESSSLPRMLPLKMALGYDSASLYGAFECGYAAPGMKNDDHGSDTVVIVLDSLHKTRSYLAFTMGEEGNKSMAVRYVEGNRNPDRFIHENKKDIPPLAWPGEWEYKTHREKNSWTGEFRIPWAVLSMIRPDIYGEIGMNILRQCSFKNTNSQPTETWVRGLAPWSLHYFSPVNFGTLTLKPPEGRIPWSEPDAERNSGAVTEWEKSDNAFSAPVIAREDTGYRIRLDNGASIPVLVSGDRFIGIGAVQVGKRFIRAGAHPVAVELWKPEGFILGKKGFRLVKIRVEGSHAILELEILGESGMEGTMEWRFAPASETIGGTAFKGFAYSFHVITERKYVGRLLETGSWELDGDASGTALHMQSANVNPLNALEEGSLLRLHADTNSGWNQCFDLHTGRRGALFIGYRTPFLVLTGIAKYPGEHVVRTTDQVIAGRSRDFLTPQKEVLYADFDGSSADLWTDAFDFQAERWRKHVSIRETPVVPTSWLPMPYLFDNRGDYRETADREIPKLAKLGFKRLILPPIWKSHTGVCVSWELTVDPKSGGEEGIAYLVSKAHEYGMTVVSWLGTAMYVSGTIPYFFPGWVVHNLDGSPMDTHYNELRVMNYRSGYYAYFLDSLRKVREKTGLDGYWIDSWSTFAVNGVDYAVPDARPHIMELLRSVSELQKMGYTDILIEGMGPFGLSASWLYQGLFAHPEYSYKTSFYGGTFTAEQYFRFLANKSTPHIGQPGNSLGVGVKEIGGKKEYAPDDDLLKKGKYNRDFNSVSRYMKHRTVLPDDRGILWEDVETGIRVLFTFKQFDAQSLKPGYVRDVSAEQTFGKPGKFIPEAGHVYLFSVKKF